MKIKSCENKIWLAAKLCDKNLLISHNSAKNVS